MRGPASLSLDRSTYVYLCARCEGRYTHTNDNVGSPTQTPRSTIDRALHCGDSRCAIFYDSERARHELAFALQVFNKFEFVVRTHKGARRVSAVVAPGSPKADRGGCTHRSELARSWPYFSRNVPEPLMLAQS